MADLLRAEMRQLVRQMRALQADAHARIQLALQMAEEPEHAA